MAFKFFFSHQSETSVQNGPNFKNIYIKLYWVLQLQFYYTQQNYEELLTKKKNKNIFLKH